MPLGVRAVTCWHLRGRHGTIWAVWSGVTAMLDALGQAGMVGMLGHECWISAISLGLRVQDSIEISQFCRAQLIGWQRIAAWLLCGNLARGGQDAFGQDRQRQCGSTLGP